MRFFSNVSFATKLYLAGLSATVVVFSSLALSGLYFYDRTAQLHAIDSESKSVRLSLVDIQRQAYAFYVSGNKAHYEIHQNIIQVLHENIQRLTEDILKLQSLSFSGDGIFKDLNDLTAVMLKNVAAYEQHFKTDLANHQYFEKQLVTLFSTLRFDLRAFESLLPQVSSSVLRKDLLVLRQYEQSYALAYRVEPDKRPAYFERITEQITKMSTYLAASKLDARAALQTHIVTYQSVFQDIDDLLSQREKQRALNQADSELNSVELDAYDLEDMIAMIVEDVQEQLIDVAALLLGIFILLSLLVNGLFTRGLTRPLTLLAEAAEQVGKGDLTRKIQVRNQDEVGALAHAFNAMVENIRSSRAELIASEQYEAKQIMTAMGEGLLVLNDQAIVIRVNPALCKLLGRPETSILNKHMNHLLVSTELQIEQLFNQERAGSITLLKHCDHSQVATMISGSPMLDDQGAYNGAVLVVNDMRQYLALEADKEQAEENLKEAHHQRLESLGIMAGGVAHDFNNLLTPMIGNTEILLSGKYQEGKQEHYLRRTLDLAMQAARLSKQMLAYSGSGRLASEPIQLSDLVKDMENTLQSSVAKNVQVCLATDAALPWIEGDIAELEQVLLNLVINASDAMDGDAGTITLATKLHDVTQLSLKHMHTHAKPDLKAGTYAAFIVQDAGCGMSEEIKRKLFDPFFTTKFTGRGLGMSAVLGIIHSHLGALFVDSKEGVGSTFTAAFPIVVQQKIKPITQDVAPLKESFEGHLLIVDDDSTVLDVLDDMLNIVGCTTIRAGNGQEALDIYIEHQASIDAVVLDVTMPVMSGAICLTKLIEINPDVKVILSSGYAQIDVKNQFKTEYLAAYLQKPYSIKKILEILNIVLD